VGSRWWRRGSAASPNWSPTASPACLADALERLADDPDLRHRLGREGRRRVVQDYDIKESGQAMAERFAEVVQGG
jgi:glycosyltransferase involved in cell wall biosynthesis